jgi:hypothetical protein
MVVAGVALERQNSSGIEYGSMKQITLKKKTDPAMTDAVLSP